MSRTIAQFKEEILKEYPRLTKDDTFTFECKPGISCFNKCCNDVNIFLTPFDVIRLKNKLGISSSEFLEKYTLLPIDENFKHPIVVLKMSEGTLNCPFVDAEKGCTVYDHRPWPCRMYPVGIASAKDEPVKAPEAFYFLLKESICNGFESCRQWTIDQWMEDQGVLEYNVFGEYFKEISLHKYFQSGKNLEPVKLEMFFTVCYDIDKFRQFVFESTFLHRFEVDEFMVEEMRASDEELLRFGFIWLRYALFGESTMKLKPEYAQAVENAKQ